MSESESETVRVTIDVAVDPATAFAVFTDEVDAWWRRGPQYRFRAPYTHGTMRFEPGVGGRLVEIYDEATGDEYEVGTIVVWEPGARLVVEWRGPNYGPGQATELDVRFVGTEEGTRVDLSHRGWERFPLDHPVRHGMAGRELMFFRARAWADQLASIKAYAKRVHDRVE